MPDSIDIAPFKDIFRTHPAGVAIITLQGNGQPAGFTATSVISVSASPPVIVFSVQGSSSNLAALEQSDSVVIHFLDQRHEGLAVRFATPGIDRFEHSNWQALPSGEPLLTDVATWMRCRVINRTPAGSSMLFQVCPQSAKVELDRAPIIYHDRLFHGVGALPPG